MNCLHISFQLPLDALKEPNLALQVSQCFTNSTQLILGNPFGAVGLEFVKNL